VKAALIAAALFFPFSAVLHNVVFYRSQCLLNPTGEKDYSLRVIADLFRNDLSMWLAVALSAASYLLLWAIPNLMPWAVIALIASLPVTLWVWDIPLTKRTICAHIHDNRTWIRGRHVYAASALAFVGLAFAL
jgi:hypothetical protein